MSIGPGVMALPTAGPPGLQQGGLQQGGLQQGGLQDVGSRGTPAPADFGAALKDGAAASPAPQLSTQPGGAVRPGALAPRNTLGDQVLGGLEKLGRGVEAMQSWASQSWASQSWASQRPAPTAAAAKAAASPQPGAKPPDHGDAASGMRDLWEASMRDQRQSYATVFDFELIAESSQSLLKSLKSLLTQGGG